MVHVRREFTSFAPIALDFRSDEGNRNMYLVDERGRRYDSISTTGAAREGGRLVEGAALVGGFVFPAPTDGPGSFTFHDDDLHLKLEGLRPDPRLRIDEGRQETLRSVVLAATALRLSSTWSGRSPRAPIEETYWLTKGTRGWAGEAAFSVAQAKKRRVPLRPKAHSVDAFLGDLGASPLLDYPYSPSLRHTDSYPHLQFEVLAGERSVRFESESQAHGNVPWAITLEGHTYTVPTGAPADALDRLRSGLGLNVRQIFDELGRDLESER